FSFRGMLEKQADKTEVVVTFLALLELMKIGKIHLTQEHLFDDMLIETLEPEGEEEDLDLSELEEDIEGYREDEEEVGGAGVAADGGTERDYE
ncbi:MAG: segregation/condensation protein A, partial [Hungatella hathewayi]|nr:segregation/condensation protein A [Hungatella hathewayi]